MTRAEFFKRFEDTPQGHQGQRDKGAFKKNAPASTQTLFSESLERQAL
jgi:hypothetical protein